MSFGSGVVLGLKYLNFGLRVVLPAKINLNFGVGWGWSCPLLKSHLGNGVKGRDLCFIGGVKGGLKDVHAIADVVQGLGELPLHLQSLVTGNGREVWIYSIGKSETRIFCFH